MMCLQFQVLPMNELEKSFYNLHSEDLCKSSLVSFTTILQFLVYKSFPPWLNLFLGIFFRCYEIAFIISFLSCVLLVYRNKNNFCMLILYSTNLLNLFISSRIFLVDFLGVFSLYRIMLSLNRVSITFSFPLWMSLIAFLVFCSAQNFQFIDEQLW